jgi:hypothetical protein
MAAMSARRRRLASLGIDGHLKARKTKWKNRHIFLPRLHFGPWHSTLR